MSVTSERIEKLARGATQSSPPTRARSLFEPGRNCYRIGHAERISLIIDGEAYFKAFVNAALRATRSILIVGWDFHSRTQLHHGIEGLPEMLGDFLKEEFTRGPFTKLMAVFAYPAIRRFRRRVDHRRNNGAALLGLRGIVVKSHGSADRLAFATALARAANEARHGLIERIGEEIARLNALAAPAPGPAEEAA